MNFFTISHFKARNIYFKILEIMCAAGENKNPPFLRRLYVLYLI